MMATAKIGWPIASFVVAEAIAAMRRGMRRNRPYAAAMEAQYAPVVVYARTGLAARSELQAAVDNGIMRICQASSVNAIGHSYSRDPHYDYLPIDDEVAVVQRTTAGPGKPVHSVFTGDQLKLFQKIIRRVPCAEDVVRYAVRLAAASRPGQLNTADFIKDWVNWGAGTRAGQSLVLAGKTRALLHGRAHVTFEDIAALAQPVLRHRILVNYRAEAEGVTVEKVIGKLLETVKPGA
jgi:hypothetical protein